MVSHSTGLTTGFPKANERPGLSLFTGETQLSSVKRTAGSSVIKGVVAGAIRSSNVMVSATGVTGAKFDGSSVRQ